jgi:hypothetical protein
MRLATSQLTAAGHFGFRSDERDSTGNGHCGCEGKLGRRVVRERAPVAALARQAAQQDPGAHRAPVPYHCAIAWSRTPERFSEVGTHER